MPPLEALQEPHQVDVEKMMGKWFVISSIPTPFEKGAHNATEFYEWVDDDKHQSSTANSETEAKGDEAGDRQPSTGDNKSGSDVGRKFKVTFGFNKGSFEGKHKEMYQKGSIYAENGAEWRVQPKLFGMYIPVKLPFLIVDVAPDYSWVTIGYPSRQYLWILSRTPQMDRELYGNIEKKAVDMGYEKAKIQMVPQQTEQERASP